MDESKAPRWISIEHEGEWFVGELAEQHHPPFYVPTYVTRTPKNPEDVNFLVNQLGEVEKVIASQKGPSESEVDGFRAGDYVNFGLRGDNGYIRHFEKWGDRWLAYVVEKNDGTLDDYAGGCIYEISDLTRIAEAHIK